MPRITLDKTHTFVQKNPVSALLTFILVIILTALAAYNIGGERAIAQREQAECQNGLAAFHDPLPISGREPMLINSDLKIHEDNATFSLTGELTQMPQSTKHLYVFQLGACGSFSTMDNIGFDVTGNGELHLDNHPFANVQGGSRLVLLLTGDDAMLEIVGYNSASASEGIKVFNDYKDIHGSNFVVITDPNLRLPELSDATSMIGS